MGRADQTTKVKGMFVRPEQIAEIGQASSRSSAALRLVVTRDGEQDAMTLQAECAQRTPGLQTSSPRRLQSVTKLQGRGEARRAGLAAERRQGDRGRTAGGLDRHLMRLAGLRDASEAHVSASSPLRTCRIRRLDASTPGAIRRSDMHHLVHQQRRVVVGRDALGVARTSV